MDALVAYSDSDSEPEVGEENAPTTLYSSSSVAASKKPVPSISDVRSSKVGPQPDTHLAETLEQSNVRGYVPKRKRCHGMEEGTLSAAASTEIHTVSQYLSSPAVLDSTFKRTKQQNRISMY